MVTEAYRKIAEEYKLAAFSFTALVYWENGKGAVFCSSRQYAKGRRVLFCRPFARKGEPAMQSVTLYNGTEIPLIGYGTLQITGPAQYKRCMDDAIARPLSPD